MKINVCVETIEAYGSHTRFTLEEHLQILLNERRARQEQDFPYFKWARAARSINWFGGEHPVSLSYVKSHMPRAMLLELRFPIDPYPRMVQADVDRLLAAEKEYMEARKSSEVSDAYIRDLLKKYGIGPEATLDEDMGGATPQAVCGKWEEREIPGKLQ